MEHSCIRKCPHDTVQGTVLIGRKCFTPWCFNRLEFVVAQHLSKGLLFRCFSCLSRNSSEMHLCARGFCGVWYILVLLPRDAHYQAFSVALLIVHSCKMYARHGRWHMFFCSSISCLVINSRFLCTGVPVNKARARAGKQRKDVEILVVISGETECVGIRCAPLVAYINSPSQSDSQMSLAPCDTTKMQQSVIRTGTCSVFYPSNKGMN